MKFNLTLHATRIISVLMILTVNLGAYIAILIYGMGTTQLLELAKNVSLILAPVNLLSGIAMGWLFKIDQNENKI